MSAQCAQLDEANRAWQQYHQTQLDSFKTKLHDYVPVDDNTSFDEVAQEIVDRITKEREDFTERYYASEKAKNDLQSGSLIIVTLYLIYFYCLSSIESNDNLESIPTNVCQYC